MDAHGPLTNVRGYDQSLIADEHRNSTPDINALSMNMDNSFDEYKSDITAYRDLYAAAVEYTTQQVAEFCERLADGQLLSLRQTMVKNPPRQSIIGASATSRRTCQRH
jgi:hypothetical protein